MRLSIVCILLFLSGCFQKQNPESYNGKYVPKQIRDSRFIAVANDTAMNYNYISDPKKIIIPVLEDISMNISDLIDSIWYVPLETNENSLFGDMSKVMFTDNQIVIWDQFKTEKVLCFNKKGKFLNVIGQKGKGPSEFITPSHVTLDHTKKNILIWDGFRNSMLKYTLSGTFVSRSKKLGFSFRGFINIENGYIYDTEFAYNGYLKNICNHLIVKSNNDYKISNVGIPYSHIYEQYNLYHTFNNLQDLNGKIFYRPPMWDTIYSINNNSIRAEYILKYPDEKRVDIPVSNLKKFKELASDLVYPSKRYYITNNVIWFKLKVKKRDYWCLYNRQEEQLKVFNKYSNNLDKGVLLSPFPIATNADTMVVEMPAYKFLELRKIFNKNNPDNKIKEEVNLTDNSVLVFYTINKEIFN